MRGEGVQGVLTLICSGAAQVCHDDRVVELKEQLEVEEKDEDRQEEEAEVESGDVESRWVRFPRTERCCVCRDFTAARCDKQSNHMCMAGQSLQNSTCHVKDNKT